MTDPAGRIATVLSQTGGALRELRGSASPGVLSGVLAACWRAHLGQAERCLLLATAAQAADGDNLEELGFILGGPPPFGDVE